MLEENATLLSDQTSTISRLAEEVLQTASLLSMEMLTTSKPGSYHLAQKVEEIVDLALLYSTVEEGVRSWLEGWGGGEGVWRLGKQFSNTQIRLHYN